MNFIIPGKRRFSRGFFGTFLEKFDFIITPQKNCGTYPGYYLYLEKLCYAYFSHINYITNICEKHSKS